MPLSALTLNNPRLADDDTEGPHLSHERFVHCFVVVGSDDRTAAVYSWEVRKTGEELEDAVNKRVSVGTELSIVQDGVPDVIVSTDWV